jgi:hypothetical protein
VDWCLAQRIAIGYIQPGKPDQNAFIEWCNRTFREEILDTYLFDSLEHARTILERARPERWHRGTAEEHLDKGVRLCRWEETAEDRSGGEAEVGIRRERDLRARW